MNVQQVHVQVMDTEAVVKSNRDSCPPNCRNAAVNASNSLTLLSAKQHKQREMSFLKTIQQVHENTIVSFYHGRDYKSAQCVFIQILNDIRLFGETNSTSRTMKCSNDETMMNAGQCSTNGEAYEEMLVTYQDIALSGYNYTIRPRSFYCMNQDDIGSSTRRRTIEESLSRVCCHSESSASTDGIYDGAMLLADNIPVEIYETAAVVMFNLALVHHHLYLAGDPKELKKTISIYRQVITVIEGSSHIGSCRSLQIMLCASYHNSGQLVLSDPAVFDLNQAETMFDHVSTILSYIIKEDSFINPTESDSTTLLSTRIKQDLNFMYCNMIFARLSTQNGHSAAA